MSEIETALISTGVGWHEKELKAETEVHGALKAAYYDAFRAADWRAAKGGVRHEALGGMFA